MPTTSETKKPVTELSIGDLESFPIWEYAIDEEGIGQNDETWVRPVTRKKIPKNAYSQLVAANFTTASNTRFRGFMVVTTAVNPVGIQPGALISDRYLVLPAVSRSAAVRENYPAALKDRENVLSALRSREGEVFPIAYRLDVPVSGEIEGREGRVE